MGSPETELGRHHDEGPQHLVRIPRAYAVSKFPITFDEWDACHRKGGTNFLPNDEGWGRGKQPVINVNWYHAQEYIGWLRKFTGAPYRLLSEAEWEYAARADSQSAYPWGEEIGKGHANGRRCGSQWGGKRPSPVGSFPPNPFGLHDMHGNVLEWVQDCHLGPDYIGAPLDGSALQLDHCEHRVARGGNFAADPSFLRSAWRLGENALSQTSGKGFRVARDLTP